MENSLKKRVLGTKRGFYGLLISVVSIIALCWMLYARDDARAEYEELKASGTCFADKAPDSWKDMSPEEHKKIARKCMAASNRLSQVEHAPSIFAVLSIIGLLLLSSSLVAVKSDADKVLEEFENENNDEKGGRDDNELS